jgi:hypothetical protein
MVVECTLLCEGETFMAKLFEYAVVYHPKPTKDAQGNDTTPADVLVTPVSWVLAKSDKEVAIIAAKGIGDDYNDKLDQVEICIRPF